MGFSLGTVIANIVVNTTGLTQAEGLVAATVNSINGHLSRIADVALGATVGAGIGDLIQKLEDIPRALIKVNSEFESFHAALTAVFKTANQTAEASLHDLDAVVASATEASRDKLVRLQADIQNVTERHGRDVAASIERTNEIVADADRRNTRSYEQRGRAAEDTARQETRAQEDYAQRHTDIQERLRDQLASYGAAAEQAAERANRTFKNALGDIAAQHAATFARVERQYAELAEKQQEAASQADATLAAATEQAQHQAAVGLDRVLREQAALRQRYNDEQLQGRQRLSEELVATDLRNVRAEQDAQEQVQASARTAVEAIRTSQEQLGRSLTALREQQLSQQLTFSEKMEDLSLKALQASTPEGRSALAQQRLRLEAEHALQQQAGATREGQAKAQQQQQVNQAEEREAALLKAVQKRLAREEEDHKLALVKIATHYAAETLLQRQQYAQQLENLKARLAEEQDQENRALVRATAARQQATARAESEARRTRQRLQDELGNADAQAARQEAKAREAHAVAIQEAEARYTREQYLAEQAAQREEQLASRTEARRVEDAERTAMRQEDRFHEMVEDEERTYTRLVAHLQEQDERRAATFANQMRTYGDRVHDLTNKTDQETLIAQGHMERLGKLASEEFSQRWVDKANEVEKALDKTGQGFRWHIPPETATEAEKIADKIKQIDEYLQVVDRRSLVDLNDVRRAFQELRVAGVDPVSTGILNIITTLAGFPGAEGQIDALSRAFVRISEGDVPRAQRELARFGIDLYSVTAKMADGTVKLLLDANHRLAAGITPEIAIQAVTERVRVLTDALARENQDTWKQLISSARTFGIVLAHEMGEQPYERLRLFFKATLDYLNGEGQARIQEFAVKAGIVMSGAFDRIAPVIRAIGEKVLAFAERLVSPEMVEHYKAIADNIGAIFEGLGKISHAIEVGIFGDLGKQLQGVDTASDDTRDHLADFLTVLEKVAGAISRFVNDEQTITFFRDLGITAQVTALALGFVDEKLNGLLVNINKVGHAIHEQLAEWEHLGTLHVLDLVDNLVIAFEKLAPAVQLALAAIGPDLDKFKDLVIEKFNQVKDAVVTWIRSDGGLQEGVRLALRTAVDTWLGVTGLGALIPGVNALLDHIYGHSIIEDWLTGLQKGLAEGLEKAADDGIAAFSKLGDGMNETLEHAPPQPFQIPGAVLMTNPPTLPGAAPQQNTPIQGGVPSRGGPDPDMEAWRQQHDPARHPATTAPAAHPAAAAAHPAVVAAGERAGAALDRVAASAERAASATSQMATGTGGHVGVHLAAPAPRGGGGGGGGGGFNIMSYQPQEYTGPESDVQFLRRHGMGVEAQAQEQEDAHMTRVHAEIARRQEYYARAYEHNVAANNQLETAASQQLKAISQATYGNRRPTYATAPNVEAPYDPFRYAGNNPDMPTSAQETMYQLRSGYAASALNAGVNNSGVGEEIIRAFNRATGGLPIGRSGGGGGDEAVSAMERYFQEQSRSRVTPLSALMGGGGGGGGGDGSSYAGSGAAAFDGSQTIQGGVPRDSGGDITYNIGTVTVNQADAGLLAGFVLGVEDGVNR